MLYYLYDMMPAKPRFSKIKLHLVDDPIAAISKCGNLHKVLLNEAADKAADFPTDGFSLLRFGLKDKVTAEEIVVAKQARICRRLAAVEKHMRKMLGPVTVDEQEFLKEQWDKQDAKLRKQQS